MQFIEAARYEKEVRAYRAKWIARLIDTQDTVKVTKIFYLLTLVVISNFDHLTGHFTQKRLVKSPMSCNSFRSWCGIYGIFFQFPQFSFPRVSLRMSFILVLGRWAAGCFLRARKITIWEINYHFNAFCKSSGLSWHRDLPRTWRESMRAGSVTTCYASPHISIGVSAATALITSLDCTIVVGL